MKCLDSTFVIDLLRNDPLAVAKARQLEGDELAITPVIAHEVLVGAFFGNRAAAPKVIELLTSLRMLDLSLASATSSASIGAALLKAGREVGDGDLMTVGAMLANNCDTIITRDVDFKRIKDIAVETY
ncbi:PIN domain-containing protein [Candidatus Woesearchaeota archaeon]|nr:PIN domain-containing protein [Candidatus Woesearchaeota archaeon]